MALAGADGKQAAELLRASVKHGAAVLGTLTEAAVKRLLSASTKVDTAKRLFTDDERAELAEVLAAVTATANLLGRARIRKRLEQAEKHAETFAEDFCDPGTSEAKPGPCPERTGASKEVEIHDPSTGEVFWKGPQHEAEKLLQEQEKDEPGHGLKIREAKGEGKGDKKEEDKKEETSQQLPPPSDYRSFRTGHPVTATVYRGETTGGTGSGMAALGHGRYYGLEPKVAERFSKKGSVKADKIDLKNPVVFHSDEEMESLKKHLESETGHDFGKKGSLYEMLTGDQPAKFTNALKRLGHDGIITTYPEAAGGQQLVVFPTDQKHAETFADHDSFTDAPTDFSAFADSPIHPLAPLRALQWFLRLFPALNVPAKPFAKEQERRGFTLAVTMDETLLGRIQGIIANVLATGQKVRATPKIIDSVLDEAGVAPKNPQYAEMITRTAMMSAYNRGSHEEMQDPDVKDSFPVWRYAAIKDNRVRRRHAEKDGRYYPNGANFEEVRGKDISDVANCRCTSIPIYKGTWKRLQAQGATVAKYAEKFCQEGENKGKPGVCPGGNGDDEANETAHVAKDATVDEVNAWQKQHYGAWTDTVPREQRQAATSYAGNMYRSVNGLLRDPGDKMHRMNKVLAEAVTKDMDAMIQSAPGLPENTTLYRGVFGSFADTIRGLNPGDEISDRGFVSTTPVESHSRENFLKDSGVLIQIHAPKGAKALPMYRFSPKQEGEMVLPRGSRFRVREVKDGVVHMELLV